MDEGQTDRTPLPLGRRCVDEVMRLHRFFEDWWNGRVPQERRVLDAGFTSALDPSSFHFASPAGVPFDRSATADAIFSAWGTRYDPAWAKEAWVRGADFRIVISNASVAWETESACAVLFHENQQVGGAGGPAQAKANGATMRLAADGTLLWLLEQETWWPGFSFNSSCPALADLPPAAVPACHGCASCLPDECGGCLGY
jgi:hypothetical protein